MGGVSKTQNECLRLVSETKILGSGEVLQKQGLTMITDVVIIVLIEVLWTYGFLNDFQNVKTLCLFYSIGHCGIHR